LKLPRWISAAAATLVLAPAVVAAPAPATTARVGFYWKNQTIPYDTRMAYRYAVAVHPQGGFSDDHDHSFAYITAQNKHVIWPKNGDTSHCGEVTPYGLEAIIAYFGRNGPQGSHEFWVAWLDAPQFTSHWSSADADYPNGFLGPHWKLSTLEPDYIRVERDTEGQLMPFLRVMQETVLLSSSATASRWANRIYLYNHTLGHWDEKAESTFEPPGSSDSVRHFTWECGGGGIWAGILETYADGDGQFDPRPAVKKVVYKDRAATITDRGVTYDSDLSIDSSFTGPSDGYRLYVGPATGRFDEFSAGPNSLRQTAARLFNGDDRQAVRLNGWPAGGAGYREGTDIGLGRLGPAERVDFETYNEGGGYTWGYELLGDGSLLLRDVEGQAGTVGAQGNDQSRPNQVVHARCVNAWGGACPSPPAGQPTVPPGRSETASGATPGWNTSGPHPTRTKPTHRAETCRAARASLARSLARLRRAKRRLGRLRPGSSGWRRQRRLVRIFSVDVAARRRAVRRRC
jgi:hypothetical protein